MNVDSLTGARSYTVYTNKKQLGFGSNLLPSCGILPNDDMQFKTGNVTITKYDLTSGIISGTFDCKIKPANCDTIFITQGRFDFKL
ncbi:MAG: hypothetical protein JWP69_1441 [Flaviaesturariibacter sp.]|nr:hypothetical protein [Flaviaesturariibacter sp.]